MVYTPKFMARLVLKGDIMRDGRGLEFGGLFSRLLQDLRSKAFLKERCVLKERPILAEVSKRPSR